MDARAPAFRFQFRTPDEAMVRAIHEAYAHYVQEGSSGLTRHQLKCAYARLLGTVPSVAELDTMLPKAHAGTYPLENFVENMCNRLCALDDVDRIRQMFHAFDQGHKGYITVDDLRAAFREVAPHVPVYTVLTIFLEVDTDRNGKVSWGEFERIVRFRAPRSWKATGFSGIGPAAATAGNGGPPEPGMARPVARLPTLSSRWGD